MECSNCGEVLESGCSVSAGLRQEDRLILDWERRHKGRSCSGALRPFGKLKWQKKKRTAYPHLSCAASRPSSKSCNATIFQHIKCFHMLSFTPIEADSPWSLIFLLVMFRKDETLGEWSLSSADIQQPLTLISNNNHDGKRRHVAFFFPALFRPSSPSPRCLCAATVPGASSLQFVVVLPLSPWGEVTPCLLVVSAALHCTRRGDLDSQSIFPLQLSLQTPKVVSCLFSRSDINLALPFYIKNACIVSAR